MIGVSIPFKREGLSELKRYDEVRPHVHVSIPFKREGLSERICDFRWQ